MPKYINADRFLADESEAFMIAQIKLARCGKNITYQINKIVHQQIQKLISDAPAEEVSEIIYCKDCIKHNKSVGEVSWSEQACPLVEHRGKAQGHEYDYHYCSFGKRKEE